MFRQLLSLSHFTCSWNVWMFFTGLWFGGCSAWRECKREKGSVNVCMSGFKGLKNTVGQYIYMSFGSGVVGNTTGYISWWVCQTFSVLRFLQQFPVGSMTAWVNQHPIWACFVSLVMPQKHMPEKVKQDSVQSVGCCIGTKPSWCLILTWGSDWL